MNSIEFDCASKISCDLCLLQFKNFPSDTIGQALSKKAPVLYNSPRHANTKHLTQKLMRIEAFEQKKVERTQTNELEVELQNRNFNRRSTVPNITSQYDGSPSGRCLIQSPNNKKYMPIRVNFSYKSQQLLPKSPNKQSINTDQPKLELKKLPVQSQAPSIYSCKLGKQNKLKLNSKVICHACVCQKLAKIKSAPSFIKYLSHSKSQAKIAAAKGLMRSESHPHNIKIRSMKNSNQNSTEATGSIEKKMARTPPFQETPSKVIRSGLFTLKNPILIRGEGSCALEEPSVKAMHRTTLLNHKEYDFGLLDKSKGNGAPQPQINLSKEVQARQWKSYVKRLIIDQEDDEHLKQSIHCSPDIRSSSLDMELLPTLGREAKGSYVPDSQ